MCLRRGLGGFDVVWGGLVCFWAVWVFFPRSASGQFNLFLRIFVTKK